VSDGSDVPAAAPAPEGSDEAEGSGSPPADEGEHQTLVGYGPRSGSAMRRARRGPATAATHAGSAAQLQVQGVFEQPGVQHTTEVVPADEKPVPATAAPAVPAQDGGARVLAKPPVR